MADTKYYSGGGEKTVAKTVILEKYLKAYLNIMRKPENWSGPKWYVDTHAGTGFSHELGVDIPGSALRALNHDFDCFYLYEKDPKSYDLLVETLNEETEADLERGTVSDTDIPRASSGDPYVQVMNMDCNEGVKWLIDHGRPNAHWFTFVDPEKCTVERELMEALCRRGNMDILFNFQTSSFFRNTSEEADHSHGTVASNLGEGFPKNAEPDEIVEWYKEDVFRKLGWMSESRRMVSEGTNTWRYDLIFAAQNETALGIIQDIYSSNPEKDVNKEIKQWRAESDVDQQGLETYVHIPSEDQVPNDENQSCLSDYGQDTQSPN